MRATVYAQPMPSAFVLGGTGQIGRAVWARFSEAGWDVTVGARGTRAPLGEMRTVTVDRREPGALDASVQGEVDVLVDLIAYTAAEADQINRLSGRVGSVVAISSASVYADQRGRTLDEARDLGSFPALLAGPLATTIVRPCAIHGPGAASSREWHFVKRALDGRGVVLLADRGESHFHTTSVANLAELVLRAAERPGDRIVNCGDPDPPSVLEIERAIATCLSHEWVEVLVPQDGYSVPAADTPWSTPRPFVLDMTAAERDLGYRPVARYRDAVVATVEWLVEATRNRDWREVLPDAALTMEGSFDYEIEDAVLAGLSAKSYDPTRLLTVERATLALGRRHCDGP
jgi:nucleoside-diphosphate-sugar epimerase